ncbi:GNAT family N-acetyltransferase [Spelaeicoccus albus]|uniref:N-acetyltransferase domain-containing protein n=1 Tax=Spelaeicoccus albus TaxID=1280376 RepID=A0A7Z0D2P0_9MICO|nr:GNAT family N-acetyltransferase [Spelaeicoccus albus]NYI67768.1 hypothetical protein [Spelaeicoccus albus]
MTAEVRVGTELRLLTRADTPAVRRLCDLDPVSNVFLAGRLELTGSADAGALGGQLWGFFRSGQLASALWYGANIIPVNAQPDGVEAFAQMLDARTTHPSSIVGPAGPVLDLITRLPHWPSPREVRGNQPVMVLSGPPAVAADPQVRRAVPTDADVIYPASVAMFTEEVGYSPVAGDRRGDYRRRVDYLISRGHTFARIDEMSEEWPAKGHRQATFKADLGAVSRSVAQVQGVWVHPAYRGRGLSESGMAAVAFAARRDVAPIVSLYVNDFNDAARAAYRRVGFTDVGTFATVLY